MSKWEEEYPQVAHLIDFESWEPTDVLGAITEEERLDPYLWTLDFMRKPENMYFTVKWLFDIELAPFQLAIQNQLLKYQFIMLLASRGASKSSSLAIYCMHKAIFEQGTKIALVGFTFRQAKIVFETCEWIWKKSPILRQMFPGEGNGPKKPNDKWEMRLGDSLIFAIPSGEGARGQRAHIIIVDEFAIMPKEAYEVIAKGFAAVSSDPIQAIKREARINLLRKRGQLTREIYDELMGNQKPNQIILAGTAYYRFNNLYHEFKRYHDIISTKGDANKLAEVLGGADTSEIDWRDFCVIRIPFDALPRGFLSDKIIGQAKATSRQTNVQMEYGAVFPEDSDGFFRLKLIESCVTNRPIELNGREIQFFPIIKGDPEKTYIMGVDPASESDNFAIVIIELHEDHRRVVYSWSTQRKFQKNAKLTGEGANKGFYRYCADKIRELRKKFSCQLIAIDVTGGGGIDIVEELADEHGLKERKSHYEPIYPIDSHHPLHDGKDKWRAYDRRPGEHIVYPFSFSKSDLVRDCNHGLKNDFETNMLLLPCIDSIEVAAAIADTLAVGRDKDDDGEKEDPIDSLDACVYNLEQLKKELCSIEVKTTDMGKETWTLMQGTDAQTNKKDRYSALLMANGVARMLKLEKKKDSVYNRGGILSKGGWHAPEWFKQGVTNFGK